MRNPLLLAASFLLVGVSLHAQTSAVAPVVWERYKISDENISLVFPKLPMRKVFGGAGCGIAIQKTSYYSYADSAVYELHIISEPKTTQPKCPKQTPSNSEMVEARLKELRGKDDFVSEGEVAAGIQWHKITNKTSTRWIASDTAQEHRWIELAVTHYPDTKPDFDRFVRSFEFASSEGKEVGDGASVTLGDAGVDITVTRDLTEMSQADRIASPTITPVFRPAAPYTKAARSAGFKGAVRLKVTYLANGSIGSVIPVAELPHGMTQQAVTAVRQVVFLPARLNGVPINVTNFTEYSWTIY